MRPRDPLKEELIIQNTVKMVAKEGLEGFGVNKLASAAGISIGTVYLYYENKEQLLVNICTTISSKFLTASLEGLETGMSFAEGLKLQWKNRHAFFKKYPLEVEFVEQMRYAPLYKKVTRTLEQQHGKLLGKFLENAVKRKELTKIPFEIYWSVAFAPLYQLLRFEMQGNAGSFSLTDAAFDQAFSIILKGLKP